MHFGFGVAIITLCAFQLLSGWMIKVNLESKKGSYNIYVVKKVHRVSGNLVYFAGKINVAIGLYIRSSKYQ